MFWTPGIIGLFIGGTANAIINYNKLTGMDYYKSITVGAATGFVAAYYGVAGGMATSALNEIHEQTLRGKNITNYDTSQIAATSLVAGVFGGVTDILTDLGKGVAIYSDDLFAPLKDFGSFGGTVGNVAGAYSDVILSPIVSDSFDDLDISTDTFDDLFSDFQQSWGIGSNDNDQESNSYDDSWGNWSSSGSSNSNDYYDSWGSW